MDVVGGRHFTRLFIAVLPTSVYNTADGKFAVKTTWGHRHNVEKTNITLNLGPRKTNI